MNTAYIYSTARLNTMGTTLLSSSEIDRLLAVPQAESLTDVLKETYLGAYLEADDVTVAIDASLSEAQSLIARIAPNAADFKVLWVQYDIHNLRVFAKATKKGIPLRELQAAVSTRGSYTPAELYEHATAGTLNRIEIGWQEAYTTALNRVESGALDQVDAVFDELFFVTIGRIATTTSDGFIKRYIKAVIDCYNLTAALRRARLGTTTFEPAFVTGGTFAETELTNKEAVIAALEVMAPGTFTAAVDRYETTGNTSELDVVTHDYLITLVKTASTDTFSSASLMLFYLRTKQAAANVRTIVVGRSSGLGEDVIRANIHTAYVNQ